ncbi:hypothetical protein NDU88_004826 [Pleurodeles waltl]|uniref:Uncharacterized protein n=1 Tax=Pleurodeles waltl TaxID=8319 RepID=A0AAV7UHH2_PLEWA|nr:hypothetical protein NDU88_004826 [Pleurodeles waltl]
MWREGQSGKLWEKTFKESFDVSAFLSFWYAKETDVVSPAPVLKVHEFDLQGLQLCVMFRHYPDVFFYSCEALIHIRYLLTETGYVRPDGGRGCRKVCNFQVHSLTVPSIRCNILQYTVSGIYCLASAGIVVGLE